MARRKTIKLATGADVRRAVSRVANMVLNNELDPKAGNTILYACNAALSAIKTEDQQSKIDELGQLLEEIQRRGK